MTTSGFASEQPNLRGQQSNQSMRPAADVRAVSVLLALGMYALLAGGVFLLPFALSPYAIQNDVYMGNLFLAPLPLIAGAVCILVGLVTVGRLRARATHRAALVARALLLAVVGAGVMVGASFLVGGHFSSVGPNATSWPPYLNLPLLLIAVGVGIVIAIVAGVLAPATTDIS